MSDESIRGEARMQRQISRLQTQVKDLKASRDFFANKAAQLEQKYDKTPEVLGLAVATWIGGMRTKPRADTGEPEKWIDTSVLRLGNAVAAVVREMRQLKFDPPKSTKGDDQIWFANTYGSK